MAVLENLRFLKYIRYKSIKNRIKFYCFKRGNGKEPKQFSKKYTYQ